MTWPDMMQTRRIHVFNLLWSTVGIQMPSKVFPVYLQGRRSPLRPLGSPSPWGVRTNSMTRPPLPVLEMRSSEQICITPPRNKIGPRLPICIMYASEPSPKIARPEVMVKRLIHSLTSFACWGATVQSPSNAGSVQNLQSPSVPARSEARITPFFRSNFSMIARAWGPGTTGAQISSSSLQVLRNGGGFEQTTQRKEKPLMTMSVLTPCSTSSSCAAPSVCVAMVTG
mmetsp:Transcript_89703/g.258617  ORF Transcript_89703/g.258617 Transcript_89703/m.258617 type:complete len:227 (-) Transcript_89703:1108-1788(-)